MRRIWFKPLIALFVFVGALSISHHSHSQIGGMGGGMGGMGGMGMSPGGMEAPPLYNEPFVVWSKPAGEAPLWLSSGRQAVESANQIRLALAKQKSCDLLEEPLSGALHILMADTGISYELDMQSFGDSGISLDGTVTLTTDAPLRDILLRILKPLDLRYCVRDSYLLITSSDTASANPAIRSYDLSYIMPDNANVNKFLDAIQKTVSPDSWVEQGGVNVATVLGSMLVVRADEETHQELEKLLYIYSTSATQSTSATPPGFNSSELSPN